MAYTGLEELNGTLDLRALLNFPNIDTPIYYSIILFVIFMIFSLGTFFREIKREGKGNLLSSLAVGGFVTTTIAFIFSLLGLIENAIVILTFVITSLFVVIYLITSKN